MFSDIQTDKRLEYIQHLGFDAYTNKQYKAAADLFGEALQIVEHQQNKSQIIYYKFWRAICYRFQQKYNLALSEYLEAISLKYDDTSPQDMFNIFLDIINVSISIPTTLESIERIIQKADLFVEKSGCASWKSMTTYNRATLYWRCGAQQQAIEAAQQALIIRKDEYPSYMLDNHYNGLIKMLIDVGDIERANEYWNKWTTTPNDYPVWRKKYRIEREIQFARANHNKEVAYYQSCKLISESFHINDIHQYIEACMINGFDDLAKPYLVDYLIQQRNSDSLYVRAFCYCMAGDYHYTKARRLANMPPVDIDYDAEGAFNVTKLQNQDFKLIKREISKAHQAYQYSLEICNTINGRLKTTYTSVRILSRIEIVNLMNNAINESI